jgi:hypothetical protein
MAAFLSGCAIPQMDLVHKSQIDASYETLGTIEIKRFEDKRPENEKEKGKTASNTLSFQTWSGDTFPEMMVFLDQVMKTEVSRSGIFETSDSATYELSGEVLSMKVDRKVTVMRYLGLIPLLAGIVASDPETTEYFWYGFAGWAVLTALDFPQLRATVSYRAVLSKNGIQIADKRIDVTYARRYNSMTEWGWTSVSNKAQDVLDEAITRSVKELFDYIESQKDTLVLAP